MPNVVNAVFPVATLLLGAGLANFLKLSELRRTLHLDAADQLAELPARLWNKKDPDAWLAMNTAVSRLIVRLNLAGIHPELSERTRRSAIAFWESVHIIGQDEHGDVWSVDEDAHETWDEMSALVAELLGTNSRAKSWLIDRRARRLLEKWDADEESLFASLLKSAPDQ